MAVIVWERRSGVAAPPATATPSPLTAAVEPPGSSRVDAEVSSTEGRRVRYRLLNGALATVEVSERIFDQETAGTDLRALLEPAMLGSSAGRASLRLILDRAAETADLQLRVTEQNLELLRAAALDAPATGDFGQDLLESLKDQASIMRRLSEQLRDTQLQAIVTGRQQLIFMEKNTSLYEFRDGGVTFEAHAQQDQFTHYLSQTGQILRRAIKVRAQLIAARRDRVNLVNALRPGDVGS